MRISIEGNVGTGKSTILAQLSKTWTVYPEPVEQWTELLTLSYRNPQRWALAMNCKALIAFTSVPEADTAGRPVIVERSPMSCKEVFARLHHNEGTMTTNEWRLFCDLFSMKGWIPDVVIYLKSSPQVCMGRMRHRARSAEESVSQDYLSKLQFAHQTMLRYFGSQVHVVDASLDSDTVFQRVSDCLQAYDTT